MRKIKFRAWDKGSNKIRKVKSINYADDGFAETILVHLVDGESYGYVNGESCELMQYTGLKDKNGKEIFEADIVKVHTKSNELLENDCIKYIGKGVIKYAKPTAIGNIITFAFGVDYINTYGFESFGLLKSNMDYEIIGNIFENPELLEVK